MKKAAKCIRVLTAPPLLITITLVLLYALETGVFERIEEMLLGVFLLGVVPALVYPIHAFVPKLKQTGRDGQRNLAFVLSIIGYCCGLICGLAGIATNKMLIIYLAYLVSVLVLTVINKCFREKASGHACSTTASLFFVIVYIGPVALVPCLALYAAMAWSSVTLKRHTPRNIATGTLAFAIAAALSYGLFQLLQLL